MEATINTKVFSVEDLNPAAYNPRVSTHKGCKALKNSMERFGYVDPIIVNERTMTIVGGHQRFDYLKKQGIKSIKAVVVNLAIEEEKALNVALNKTGEHFEWDTQKLDGIIKNIKDSFDMRSFGFNLDDVISERVNHDISQAAEDGDLSKITGKEEKKKKGKRGDRGELESRNYHCTTCGKQFTYQEAVSGEVREKRRN